METMPVFQVFFAFQVFFVVVTPVLIYWVWRGNHLTGNHAGVRLDIHRSQVWRSSKSLLAVWGLMLLLAIDHVINISLVSHGMRQFWRGFAVASLLFYMGYMIVQFVALLRQERDKRQQRLADTMKSDIGNPTL